VNDRFSETGMAQANTGGVVAEPDPMVLKMMIQTVAKFSGRAPMLSCHVGRRCRRWLIKFSCFLVFLCALLSGSVTMRQWSK
jgi:hypothetical protein